MSQIQNEASKMPTKEQAFLNALQLPSYYTELGNTLIQKGSFQPVFEYLQPDEVPEKAVLADLDRKGYGEKGSLRGCLCVTNARVFFVSQISGLFKKTNTLYQREHLYGSITAVEFCRNHQRFGLL